MRKHLFWGMSVAAGLLLATSCSSDEMDTARTGNEAQVTFSLGLEGGIGTKTRAISDGTGAKKLVYAVYDSDGNILTTIAGADENGQVVNESAFASGLTDNVTVMLAKGQTYTVVFWAQNKDCTAYTTTDFKNVGVSYDGGVNNDETRDAFFRAETFTVSGNKEISITLKRPFAQINVGVTEDDWNAAVASGVTVTTSKVVVKNAATAINLLDGTVSGEAKVTYDFAKIPQAFDTPEELTVGDKTYKYLSMCYILTGPDKSTLEGLQFTFKPDNGNEIVFDEGLNSVPVQRNWRTNIVGELLTESMTFNINIDPIYAGDYDYPEFTTVADGVSLDEVNNTYYLSSKAGLSWFADQTNTQSNSFEGYTVKLTSDIDLAGETWTPVGTGTTFKGTFDGDNYIISNMKVEAKDGASAGLFATAIGTVKNVKLKDVDITGHWKAGTVVGDGLCSKIENCHVDGGTVTITPRLVDGGYDDANNVGGIVGYLSAEREASCKNCSVNGLTITAYRDCGGVVGTAQWDNRTAPVIEGNVVSNTTVIANQLTEYKEVKAPNAGAVVGRNLANADLTKNTASNNVTVTVLTIADDGSVEVGDIPVSCLADLTNENLSSVTFTSNITGEGVAPNPYSDSANNGIIQDGVTIDGGGYTLTVDNGKWDIQTYGGTVKNLTIDSGERGIVTYTPKADVILENVIIDGPGYGINTAEATTLDGIKLVARNCTINGWSSFAGGFANAEFENCIFGQNSKKYWNNKGYSDYYDKLVRPYIDTTFTQCHFNDKFYIDLSALGEGCKVVLEGCFADGVALTADNYTEVLYALELPSGRSLDDCVEFK